MEKSRRHKYLASDGTALEPSKYKHFKFQLQSLGNGFKNCSAISGKARMSGKID